MRSVSVRCPVCGEKIRLREIPDEGDIIYCDECDSELKVISSDPLKVKECANIEEERSEEEEEEEDEDEDEY